MRKPGSAATPPEYWNRPGMKRYPPEAKLWTAATARSPVMKVAGKIARSRLSRNRRRKEEHELRLMCDEMLLRLGRWLRAAGYDTAFAAGGADDAALIAR